jgi:ATP-dependent RNA helicase RhlE
VNYDLPNVPEDYVHRIGRTGRAGATGEAVSLVCVDEHQMLKDIEKLIKQTLPRHVIPGFEPDPTAKPQPIQLRSGAPGHPNRGRPGGNRGAGNGAGAAGGAKPRTQAAPAAGQRTGGNGGGNGTRAGQPGNRNGGNGGGRGQGRGQRPAAARSGGDR